MAVTQNVMSLTAKSAGRQDLDGGRHFEFRVYAIDMDPTFSRWTLQKPIHSKCVSTMRP